MTAANTEKETVFANDIVGDVKKDFERRQKERRNYETTWLMNMNFVAGNQFCTVSPRGELENEESFYSWQEKQAFNHIAPIVETRAARLNRVRPHPLVRPFSSSDADVNSAKLATKILDSARDRLGTDDIVAEATEWSEICGTSFYKVTWNEGRAKINNKSVPYSDVAVTVCPPFEIYPDSSACANLDDCRSLIHARVYPVSEIKRLWGKDVKGRELIIFTAQAVSSADNYKNETRKDAELVIERYTRPDEMNTDGKLEIIAGDTLLYQGVLPYEIGDNSARAFPFVRQTAYRRPGCFWGTSIVERLIPVQRAYNAVKNRKHEFMNRISMGVLTVEDGSVDTDNLEEEGLSPGKILVYRQGSDKPSLMDGGNVPADFSYEEDRLLNEFVVISGVSEFARNSTAPKNVTSGVALQLITEQDEIRLSPTVDSIKKCVRITAKFIVRLYKQFASRGRIAKVRSDLNEVETFYFTSTDITSDDVAFETESELTDSPATRKSMVMDLLGAGLLSDKDGKLSESAKAKILTLMGFGNWENAQDSAQLHQKRAEEENIDIVKAEILPVDDHVVHIEEHTRFIVSGEAEKRGKNYRDKVLNHIQMHEAARQNTTESTNGDI